MDWINTMPNIIEKVRHQLHSRNMRSLREVGRFLSNFNSSDHMDYHFFDKLLNKIGIFLKTQELRKVFEKFDLDKNGLVHKN